MHQLSTTIHYCCFCFSFKVFECNVLKKSSEPGKQFVSIYAEWQSNCCLLQILAFFFPCSRYRRWNKIIFIWTHFTCRTSYLIFVYILHYLYKRDSGSTRNIYKQTLCHIGYLLDIWLWTYRRYNIQKCLLGAELTIQKWTFIPCTHFGRIVDTISKNVCCVQS